MSIERKIRSFSKKYPLIRVSLLLIALIFTVISCGTFKPAIPLSSIPPDTPDDVKNEIRKLYSVRAINRANAAVRLGNMGKRAKAAVPFLISMLDDHTRIRDYRDEEKGIPSYVRSESAWALGRIGDIRAVEPLFLQIKDEDSDDREFITESFIYFGEPAVAPLSKIFNSVENKEERFLIINLIERLGGAEAIKALSVIMNDNDHEVRLAAIKAIRSIGVNNEVELLTDALSDEHFTVRLYAARELSGTTDPRAFDPLLAALTDKYSTVRQTAVKAIGNFKNKKAVDPLIQALDDSYVSVREEAYSSLGRIGDSRAIVPILDRINYNGFLISTGSPIAALNMMSAAVMDELLPALKGQDGRPSPPPPKYDSHDKADYNWHRKVNALKLLAKLDNPRAVEFVLPAIDDEDEDVKINAIWALGAMKEKKAVQPLIKLLRDVSIDIRWNSALALGKIEDKRAIVPLILALSDNEEKVKENAAWALGKITGENFRQDKAEWEEWLKEQ